MERDANFWRCSLLGNAVKAYLAGRGATKKLVGYSYNGVVLPKLPEWDKTVYPYAVIGHHWTDWTLDGNYHLLVSSTPIFKKSQGRVTANPPFMQFILGYREEGVWSGPYNTELEESMSLGDTLWANNDILNEDGTVYFATYEPVPVYE